MSFVCKRCDNEARDGAQCSSCRNQFDFACAGLLESGWRKLGDNRRQTWKCTECKAASTESPRPTTTSKLTSTDMDSILSELKRLSFQTAAIPSIVENMKVIQENLIDLKSIKDDVANIVSSVEFAHENIKDLTEKVSSLNNEVESLKQTKDEVSLLQERYLKLSDQYRETEQRLRLNNIEIKGVPISNSENLFNILSKIGEKIKCTISKEQINYIARVPMRNDPRHKTIICAVHNRYLKEDFVAASKKFKIAPSDLGLQGDNMIFVNDHLTLENKLLLNKTKSLARERGFSYVWVKGCKILIRKNQTSPIINIKTEQDLKKLIP